MTPPLTTHTTDVCSTIQIGFSIQEDQADYGVRGSPEFMEYHNIQVTELSVLNNSVDVWTLPLSFRQMLIQAYADEAERIS